MCLFIHYDGWGSSCLHVYINCLFICVFQSVMGTSHSAQAVHIHASPASDQRPPSDTAALCNVQLSRNETDSHTSLIPPSQLRGLSGRGGGGGVRGQKYLLSLDRNMKVFLRASNLPGLEYRLRLAGYRTFHDLLSTNRETLEARGFTGIMAQRLMNAVSEYVHRQAYRTEEERLPFRLVRRGQRLQNEPSESMKENPNYHKQNLKRQKSLGESPTKKHSNIIPAISGATALRNVVQLPSQVRLMNESDLEIQHLLSSPPPPEISSVSEGEDGDDNEAQELVTVVGDGGVSGDNVGGGEGGDGGVSGVSGDNELVTLASKGGAGADDSAGGGGDVVTTVDGDGVPGDVNDIQARAESSANKLPLEDISGQKILGVIVKRNERTSLLHKESSQPSQPLEEGAHSLDNITTGSCAPEDTDSSANPGSFASRFSRCFSVPADFDLTVDEETTDLIFEECVVVSRVRAFSCPANTHPSFFSSSFSTDNHQYYDTQHNSTTPLYTYSWHTR